MKSVLLYIGRILISSKIFQQWPSFQASMLKKLACRTHDIFYFFNALVHGYILNDV